MTIEEAKNAIGERVEYKQWWQRQNEKGQKGVITSVNGNWVFVRYDDTRTLDGIATNAGDLILLGGG